MTFLEFALVLNLLIICPYLPAAIAACKSGICKKASDVQELRQAHIYVIAEFSLVSIVLMIVLYFAEFAPFSVLDSEKLFGAHSGNGNLAFVWICSWYFLAAIGVLLGVLFIRHAVSLSKSGSKALFYYFNGVVCLVYGLLIPVLMTALVAAIRDSHLIH